VWFISKKIGEEPKKLKQALRWNALASFDTFNQNNKGKK
jgi:hypothetical protein